MIFFIYSLPLVYKYNQRITGTATWTLHWSNSMLISIKRSQLLIKLLHGKYM